MRRALSHLCFVHLVSISFTTISLSSSVAEHLLSVDTAAEGPGRSSPVARGLTPACRFALLLN